ncbi:1-aminocyclopropane-1-carboxylate oxidase homolog 1-like isoform X2 [Chenopodium quinoa]|uniref:1-aminocyclopropane-1-carboxylate oxidase homolog 1-like isoform X2 n=1 Tax=Chenopodium quinoa TaxID=63459 RepID=UPI000B777949|nr:1-aminocyclopropane-1-carboxylate oxidase homolog 1-like isoform X2 [Chenopodium quinoa]
MGSQNTIDEALSSYDRINDLKAFDEEKTGVKGLVDAETEGIPSIFVRSSKDRSKDFETCDENLSVPIIDIGQVGQSNDRTAEIVKEIFSASKEWGFFQVVNHGIPLNLLKKTIDGTRMFHEQDAETKKEYYSRDFQSKRVMYYSNHDLFNSNAANWRDSLYVNTLHTAGEIDPQELPPICKDVILEYVNHILKFGDHILMLLSMGLGLDPEHLGNLAKGKKGWSFINHYYPACPEPELTLGINGHADNSFITILLQDQIGGLQILHQNKWVNITPVSSALIVNFGNILQIITNDVLKSVYHRVIAKSVGPRTSVAFFFRGNFSSKKIYGPIKELTSKENPPIYRDFTIEEITTYFFSKSLDWKRQCRCNKRIGRDT